MLGFSLCGCQRIAENNDIDIVCTVFPIYDWVMNIIGDTEGVEVTLLVKNGTDPHSYSPTPTDIAKIYSCDMLIYVGGESDAWLEDVLDGVVNEDMVEVRLLELLGDRAFLHEHEDDVICDDDCHEHHHEGENAYDEHVWLSIKNAVYLCERLLEELKPVLAAEAIISNAEDYISSLLSLDAEYERAVSESARKTLLFADRFPFRYLTEDYGIEYFAAFSGCAADVEASFETITRLAKKTDELSLGYVLILESSDHSLAQTVIESSKSKSAGILVMDSMQSVTETDMENGVSYISIMRENLAALKTALE